MSCAELLIHQIGIAWLKACRSPDGSRVVRQEHVGGTWSLPVARIAWLKHDVRNVDVIAAILDSFNDQWPVTTAKWVTEDGYFTGAEVNRIRHGKT